MRTTRLPLYRNRPCEGELPTSTSIARQLERYPYKFNYLEVYERTGHLTGLVERLDALARAASCFFVGFDLVLHETVRPGTLDPSLIPARFEVLADETAPAEVDLAHHMVSVFRWEEGTVAGPLFGSMLNQLLQSPRLPFHDACRYSLERLEMLLDGHYDALFIGMPSFDRWRCESNSPFELPKTFSCLLRSPAARWVASDASIPATYFLLARSDANARALERGAGFGLMLDVQAEMHALNCSVDVDPDPTENAGVVHLMEATVGSIGEDYILDFLAEILGDRLTLADVRREVERRCSTAGMIWRPLDPDRFRQRLRSRMPDSSVYRASYRNPAAEGRGRRTAEVECSYLVPPGRESGVSVMIAEDSVGGAALNPRMHTHPSPSIGVLLDGDVMFEALVDDEGEHGTATSRLLEDASDLTIVCESLVPGSVLFFTDGMAHRFVPRSSRPFRLLVVQRGDVPVDAAHYSRPIPEAHLADVKVATQEQWRRSYEAVFSKART